MNDCRREDLSLAVMDNHEANAVVAAHHYLKRPIYIGRNVSYRVIHRQLNGFGVLMYGYPVFHTRHWLVGNEEPLRNGELVELCRVWMPDEFPRNSESCSIGLSLKMLQRDWPKLHDDGTRRWLPMPKAVISFADAEHFHEGTIYKAANFVYLGWVRGRKATPGHGQGRWSRAKREGVGQRAGIRKNAYLYVMNSRAGVNIEQLRKGYHQ